MNWAVLSTIFFFSPDIFCIFIYKLLFFLLFVVFLAKEEKRDMAILFTTGFYFFPKDMFCTYCFLFIHLFLPTHAKLCILMKNLGNSLYPLLGKGCRDRVDKFMFTQTHTHT